jgi:methyltransferase
VLELCSLAFRLDRRTKEDAVAAALFGDGAAAAVLRSGPADGHFRVRGTAEHTWPDTLDLMGWTFDPVGFGVVLSRTVPQFVERSFPPVAKRLMEEVEVDRAEVGRAAGAWSRRWRRRSRCPRARSITSARCCANTATCPRPRCCSRSSACSPRRPRAPLRCPRSVRASPRACSCSTRPVPDALPILAFVTAQRLAELWLSARNERKLRARGAYEVGAGHFPVMAALHAAWLLGLWWFAWDAAANWWLVALYLLLQVARYWVIATLGERWTVRVLVLPGAPLVRAGPYRFLRHPNYLVVALEVALLPLAFGLIVYAAAFSVANLAVLAWRIRVEEGALAGAAAGGPSMDR